MTMMRAYLRRGKPPKQRTSRAVWRSRSQIGALPGFFELYLGALILLLGALAYKMTALGILALAILATAALAARENLGKLNLVFIFTMLYVADATITAFLVSFGDGVARTIQFAFVFSGLLGIYLYSWRMNDLQFERAVKWVAFATLLIFVHLVFYHIGQGRYSTWKYLYDTKLAISLIVFLFFALLDFLRKKYVLLPCATILSILVIASAERKAFLLFAVISVFSTVSWKAKAFLFAFGSTLLILVATSGLDSGYLSEKLARTSTSLEGASDRYFLTVENIGDQSDVVREFVNRNARRLFEENPWFGVGATGYWKWSRTTFGDYAGLSMNVHGEINRVPAEGGIVGIIIALAYLVAVAWRTAYFAFLRPERTGSSLERAPFYLLLYVLCYAYAEAFDTALLFLVGICGMVAARLPAPRISAVLQHHYQGWKRSGMRPEAKLGK